MWGHLLWAETEPPLSAASAIDQVSTLPTARRVLLHPLPTAGSPLRGLGPNGQGKGLAQLYLWHLEAPSHHGLGRAWEDTSPLTCVLTRHLFTQHPLYPGNPMKTSPRGLPCSPGFQPAQEVSLLSTQ